MVVLRCVSVGGCLWYVGLCSGVVVDGGGGVVGGGSAGLLDWLVGWLAGWLIHWFLA